MILPINQRPTVPSNFGGRREAPPEFIIMHGSALAPDATGAGELRWLQSADAGISYSYYVQKSGEVAQLVPDECVAWHAGISVWDEAAASWRGFPFPPEDAGRRWERLNNCSLGVGLEHHGLHGEPYPEAQLAAAAMLVGSLMGEFEIPPYRVLTHAMVSAPRKVDPVGFDLPAFLERIPI